MPRIIPPEAWERYYELLRGGYSRTDASRRSGVSMESVRRFEAGDPNSSGNQWLRWREAIKAGDVDCPTCGRKSRWHSNERTSERTSGAA